MKAVLNVNGTKLLVSSIHYQPDGKASAVYAIDENGHEIRYIEKAHSPYDKTPHIAIEDLDGALEFPEVEARIVEERNKLIEHLEDLQKEEHNTLTDLAIEMAEFRTELPCERLGDLLVQKQNEYFLMQQRVFGIIDTVEEAKAYTEGYYANVNDPAVKA